MFWIGDEFSRIGSTNSFATIDTDAESRRNKSKRRRTDLIVNDKASKWEGCWKIILVSLRENWEALFKIGEALGLVCGLANCRVHFAGLQPHIRVTTCLCRVLLNLSLGHKWKYRNKDQGGEKRLKLPRICVAVIYMQVGRSVSTSAHRTALGSVPVVHSGGMV